MMSKITKKIFYISLLCCIALILVSCVGSSSLTYWINKEVITVELINYDNPEAIGNPSEKYALDLKKIEVLETLSIAEFENFSKEINIRVHMKMNRKQFLYSHNGIGLKFTYEDNSFQIITLTEIDDNNYFFVGSYDEIGIEIASKDVNMPYASEKFKEVINKYFTTQI